jgi:hypothetical protein
MLRFKIALRAKRERGIGYRGTKAGWRLSPLADEPRTTKVAAVISTKTVEIKSTQVAGADRSELRRRIEALEPGRAQER